METVDIAVIGAGVVGLAVAYELARTFPGQAIAILEKNSRFGQEISSRNSEVIHAGLYYPQESLKTKLCVEGNELLYEFCARYQVRHQRIGKLIVATHDGDLPVLERLYRQGTVNGVQLQVIEARELNKLEPNISAIAALLSVNTGIIDSDNLMRCLYRLTLDQGVLAVFRSPVTRIDFTSRGYRLETGGERLLARVVVNAAGLASDRVAAMVGLDIDRYGYRLHYCKGEYYRLTPRLKINHLVYPPPEHAGLGIHITLDLHGGQRLGPNAYYVDKIDYAMDETHRQEFYTAAWSYLPDLQWEDLQPGFAGIRPKLQGPGETFRDFVISEETEKGLPGFVNLIGIESPGLTSCLAIAQYVASLIKDRCQ
ncbi:MAG: NAD(P)/FAD-dependent oxidoreductase [Firmicutes bacterium]|nr:NAD(P)/FAD-dependent oxidoreductase [Bacillota bacterium]